MILFTTAVRIPVHSWALDSKMEIGNSHNLPYIVLGASAMNEVGVKIMLSLNACSPNGKWWR